jgi:hypothetical protein
MVNKTLSERYSDELLSDNSDQYKQCKDCVFRDVANYRKGICDIYDLKPSGIRKNTDRCEYYEKE